MANFYLKKRIILTALGVLLVADATLAYLNLKMNTARETPQQVLAADTRQLKLLKADVERASAIQKNIPDVLKKFDAFEADLPPSTKGYSAISQELNGYALDTHLLIGDLRFNEKELTERKLDEVAMEATVAGDYNGIVRFVNHLQRSKNLYIVDSLQLESDPSGQGPPNLLRISLHLRTYFRKV
ncbi:MAG TPA: type 4a pilus biogenesis protein PilO [Verrucomicrobiae bacterium]|nr:type 4a pilus biogenesis protein PilO [Verrucomicrobiae bacterium]